MIWIALYILGAVAWLGLTAAACYLGCQDRGMVTWAFVIFSPFFGPPLVIFCVVGATVMLAIEPLKRAAFTCKQRSSD